MASLPTGSDHLLEIQTGNICIVIKGKPVHHYRAKPHRNQHSTQLRISGTDIQKIRILGKDVFADGHRGSVYCVTTAPLFFQQIDYPVFLSGADHASLSYRQHILQKKLVFYSQIQPPNGWVINFGNNTGIAELTFSCNGRKCLCLRFEVFPVTATNGKTDHRKFSCVGLDLGYRKYDFHATTERILDHLEYFRKAANAVRCKLTANHPLGKHTVYNAPENQFAKYVLSSTEAKLRSLREHYLLSVDAPDLSVLTRIDRAVTTLTGLLQDPFFKKIQARNSPDCIAYAAPAYHALHKHFRQLQREWYSFEDARQALPQSPLSQALLDQLSTVNWSVQDVLVGSLGSVSQFIDNSQRRYYYVPARYIKTSNFPIRYIALYQSRNLFQDDSGIRYYGEVAYVNLVHRKDIDFPMTHNNSDELYYAFRIDHWHTLPHCITIKDAWVSEPKFTNLFLLEHSTQSFELFHIHSAMDFQLMAALRKAYADLSAPNPLSSTYRVSSTLTVTGTDNFLTIVNNSGIVLDRLPVNSFEESPCAYLESAKSAIRRSL